MKNLRYNQQNNGIRPYQTKQGEKYSYLLLIGVFFYVIIFFEVHRLKIVSDL